MPIAYSTSLNNRFNPPVYQWSWDKANSTIFRQDGTSEDAYIATTWSQVYNSVGELYTGGKGFSIKPLYGTPDTDKVMFRLPKDDSSYSYYSYDGQVIGNPTSISRTDNGRLVFEKDAANVVVSFSNQSSSNNIFFIGNPFIATLDMKKFFDTNPDFERNYWIIIGGGLSAVQIAADGTITSSGTEDLDGTIVPMQSFFAERTSAANTVSVTFIPDMTIGLSNNSQKIIKSATAKDDKPSGTLRIKAARGNTSSNILVQKKNDASNDYYSKEDVQVIMDSNLDDVPVLYTMAGTKAVMINTVSELDSIPLGIFSKDDRDVTLTFDGIRSFNKEIFLHDKLLNKSIALSEPISYATIPGNTHGRYYLKLSSSSGLLNDNNSITVYSQDKGTVAVKSTSPDNLKDIQVYDLRGILIKELKSVNSTYTKIDLSSGQVYILKISSELNNLSTKVYCR